MDFSGLEIVRLNQDHPDDGLRAGDCGVVWGVYGSNPEGPFFYEATFCDENEQDVDLMFDSEEVTLVDDLEQAPFPNHLRQMQQLLDTAEEQLRQSPELARGSSVQSMAAFSKDVLVRSTGPTNRST